MNIAICVVCRLTVSCKFLFCLMEVGRLLFTLKIGKQKQIRVESVGGNTSRRL